MPSLHQPDLPTQSLPFSLSQYKPAFAFYLISLSLEGPMCEQVHLLGSICLKAINFNIFQLLYLKLQVPRSPIPSHSRAALLQGCREKRNKVWVYDTAIWLGCSAGILSELHTQQEFFCRITVHTRWPEGGYVPSLGLRGESGPLLLIFSRRDPHSFLGLVQLDVFSG